MGWRRIYPDVYGLPACQSTGDCRTYSRDRRAYAIEFEEHHIAVTMSFGVYQLDGDQTMDQNVKQADERLYQAKTTGRNRVVV